MPLACTFTWLTPSPVPSVGSTELDMPLKCQLSIPTHLIPWTPDLSYPVFYLFFLPQLASFLVHYTYVLIVPLAIYLSCFLFTIYLTWLQCKLHKKWDLCFVNCKVPKLWHKLEFYESIAMFRWRIKHWSRGWSCTAHVTDPALIMGLSCTDH